MWMWKDDLILVTVLFQIPEDEVEGDQMVDVIDGI